MRQSDATRDTMARSDKKVTLNHSESCPGQNTGEDLQPLPACVAGQVLGPWECHGETPRDRESETEREKESEKCKRVSKQAVEQGGKQGGRSGGGGSTTSRIGKKTISFSSGLHTFFLRQCRARDLK